MNREIKFRAWWPDEDGVKGNMLENPISGMESINSFFKEMVEGDTKWVFMQYTGLKDKNGKEIYEGDIVKTDSGTQEVEWETLDTSDDMYCGWATGFHFAGFRHKEIEVIGNIYETPELLKV